MFNTGLRAAGVALFTLLALHAQEGTGPENRTLGAGRNYGRSIVISQQGIAATSQVLASQDWSANPGSRRIGGGRGHRLQRCVEALLNQ